MKDNHPLRYFVEIAGRRYEVRDVEGRETISKPFHFELAFALVDTMRRDAAQGRDVLDPDDLVKTEVTLLLERDGVLERAIHGLVFEARLHATLTGVPDLQLVVKPGLSLLQHRTDIRVFRNKTAPQIVTEVLAAFGIKPDWRLRDDYEIRPYCVQFRESDFDFVSRLLEDEGIYYYFGNDGSIVYGDSVAAYDVIAGISELPYRAGYGLDHHEDAIIAMACRAAVSVGKVSLRDFNPEHPSLDMDVSARGPTAFGAEWYDYPGEYTKPAEGLRKARLRSAAFAYASESIQGRSLCARILPGHTVKLFNVPDGLPDGELVITGVRHAYRRSEDGFSVTFEARQGRTICRPLQETPIPQMTNPLTAIVTCPPGEDDIHTDEMGRVKIHFHWDRLQPYDDDCSHWVPVVQDNTGHSVAIPRRDWEMLVHFLEGDPDRPVVLGRVYHGDDVFPTHLPEGKTRTSLRSLVTPSRDGVNFIQFEDNADREHVSIFAEKDQNVVVANDKSETTLVNESGVVSHDERIEIGMHHTEAVGQDHWLLVKGDQVHKVGGNREKRIAEADVGHVDGNRFLSIGGGHIRRIHTHDSVSANNLTEIVGAADVEVSNQTNSTQVNRSFGTTIGGSSIHIAKYSMTESAAIGKTETIGGAAFSQAAGEMMARVDTNRVVVVGGALAATANKDIALTGAEKIRLVATNEIFEGADEVMMKVGETTIMMKNGTIGISSPATISLKISGPNNQAAGKSTQV